MSMAHLFKAGGSICAFFMGLLFMVTDLHAAGMTVAAPDDAATNPGTPSSLALLATGLVFVLFVRRHYRMR